MKINAKWLAVVALSIGLAVVSTRYGTAKGSDDVPSVAQNARLITKQIQQLQALANKVNSANGADTSELEAAFQQERKDLQSNLDNIVGFVKENSDPHQFNSKAGWDEASYRLWSQRLTGNDTGDDTELTALRAQLSQCRSQMVNQNGANALNQIATPQ